MIADISVIQAGEMYDIQHDMDDADINCNQDNVDTVAIASIDDTDNFPF